MNKLIAAGGTKVVRSVVPGPPPCDVFPPNFRPRGITATQFACPVPDRVPWAPRVRHHRQTADCFGWLQRGAHGPQSRWQTPRPVSAQRRLIRAPRALDRHACGSRRAVVLAVADPDPSRCDAFRGRCLRHQVPPTPGRQRGDARAVRATLVPNARRLAVGAAAAWTVGLRWPEAAGRQPLNGRSERFARRKKTASGWTAPNRFLSLPVPARARSCGHAAHAIALQAHRPAACVVPVRPATPSACRHGGAAQRTSAGAPTNDRRPSPSAP